MSKPDENTTSYLGIWRAMQDLGAELRPLLNASYVPDWALKLSDAIDAAQEPVRDMCEDTEDAG